MNHWLLILGMLAITFATRYSLFALPHLQFPAVARQAMHYVPTAVLTAIVVPVMFYQDGELALRWDNAYLLAGLATIAIAGVTRHLLAAIGGGLLLFFVLRWQFGQLPI